MAGGYDNEDRQAELREHQHRREQEERDRLARRREQLRRDNLPEPGELPRESALRPNRGPTEPTEDTEQ